MNAVGYLFITIVVMTCTVLLARGYQKSRARMLFWSALCFAGLTVTNALLLVDLVLFPAVDLYPLRLSLTLASVSVLVFGFIWDSDRT